MTKQMTDMIAEKDKEIAALNKKLEEMYRYCEEAKDFANRMGARYEQVKTMYNLVKKELHRSK
jgi:ABC-type nitrate/sulfonate/bicarbonate transport system substrate-binding protein